MTSKYENIEEEYGRGMVVTAQPIGSIPPPSSVGYNQPANNFSGANYSIPPNQNTTGVGYQPTIVQASTLPPQANNGPVIAQNVFVMTQFGQHQPSRRIPRPPAGRWADGLCDCFRNLFPSCWCWCFCCSGMWLVSQMAEKTQLSPFSVYWGFICTVWFIAFVIEIITGGTIIIWLPAVVSSIMAIILRIHIHRRENMGDGFFSLLLECCTGFWCWGCSVCQMARHVYGYTKVLDGDSDVYRDDNYERV